jgi:tetratricopeptide (TPR) repeat protein
MPETARILRFPDRSSGGSAPLTREEALETATAYLEMGPEDRSAMPVSRCLEDADVLLSVCGLLRDRVNTLPLVVAKEASFLYGWVVDHFSSVGLFDEREFFSGEYALVAGIANRLLGRREETERWLDRAEAGFRHTVSPAAHLARVSYTRLTLRYDMRRHDEVLELLPSTARTFEKLGMAVDLAKCRFLEAMALKELGRVAEATEKLLELASGAGCRVDPALQGMAFLNLGDIKSAEGRFDVALKSYRNALPLLQAAKRYATLADLKGMLGETLRRMGQHGSALEAYREAVRDYSSLGMTTRAAYLQIVVAETLLEVGRTAEAEFEIRSALPTIQQEKMVPEGFAAVALLNESVRLRKTDPKALLQLREYLQAKN